MRVGTSGWVYPPWRKTFYPDGLVQRRELEYLSRTLNSVEINGSFYSLQRPSSYQRWAQQTPADFEFAVKGPRYVTHMRRLVDVDEALANFFASGVLALGAKLGPILWQLPPTLAFDAAVIRDFCARLPRSTGEAARCATHHGPVVEGRALTHTDLDAPMRHAIEPRHPSFTEYAMRETLAGTGVAVVLADSAGTFPVLDVDTADFRYLRLHGDAELYASGYTDAALDDWAARVRRMRSGGHGRAGEDVYVYFDNDAKVRAPFDAAGLLARLE
ncbi:DUF72 domain-containing protein [Gordonia jinhuaensis]|uniref:DUF72 domain-containing protein n=1 Tax=Gordonia jinhuaensis TaxID=1517702 RepID=A0A916WSA3_9ACTN|nr:hypothetical protein GCM10011489_17620 [Gordonia jinhuaensis]